MGDPVSGSEVEEKLEEIVRRLMKEKTLNEFEVEEHAVTVTYSDPLKPNHLQVSHKIRHSLLLNQGHGPIASCTD